MSEKFLKLMKTLMGAALLVLSPLKLSRLSTYTSYLIVFIMAGCSSLHVDISPAVDWNQVKVIEFQPPLQNSWKLTQPIRSELINMGFKLDGTPTNADLLLSYFTQDSPDLTAEGEVLTKLKSLHVQFIDPESKELVAAFDYFYPGVTNPSAPEAGVKEVFSKLRQQIHNETNSQSAVPARVPSQTVLTVPALVDQPAQSQKSQIEGQKSNAVLTRIKSTENEENNDQSEFGAVVVPDQETATTVLKKTDNKPNKAVQETRSPWLPKLKSWGFENWGQDSASDY